MSNVNVRLRSKSGVSNVRDVSPSLSFFAFQELVAKNTGIQPNAQLLLSGFPPKPISIRPTEAISNAIKNGDTIIVEETEIKPDISETKASISTPSLLGMSDDQFFMIRRKMEDDNSCLFSAVRYVLDGRARDNDGKLRKLISQKVKEDPITYNEGFLGKSNSEYSQWILEKSRWGGGIELSILSKYYQTEICAIDISTKKMYCYGENMSLNQRVYLLYDGIHYDSLVLSPLEDGPEDFDITIFNPLDNNALLKAKQLVEKLNSLRQYTDLAKFQLRVD